MRQLVFVAVILLLASCGNETTPHKQDKGADDTTLTQQQRDSLEKIKEEEEMSEHVIEGAFDALNR
jgi:PBP1b-binding outer membrane lipoprotein LpoB